VCRRGWLICSVGLRLTPPLSVGSSLSCQLNAAAANTSSQRSSTNFSTSSDNADDVVNSTSADVGYVSALDFTRRPTALSPTPDHQRRPPTASPSDVIEPFPVGGGRSTDTDRRLRVDQLPAEVDVKRRPTSDHVTRSMLATKCHGRTEPLLVTTASRAGRPTTWSCDAGDVIVTSPSQRDAVSRGVITTTP